VTPTGIETADGQHQDLDILVCATGKRPAAFRRPHSDTCTTGFDLSFQWPFSIIGRNGLDIRDQFTPYPKTYLGVCVDGFPNFFVVGGPNAVQTSASFITFLDRQAMYAVKATLKLQRERMQTIEISRGAVEDFDEYLEVRRDHNRWSNN